MTIIAPSVLSADFLHLEAEMKAFDQSKAQWLHYDVMDGHFVPNLSFGPDILRQMCQLTDKFVDMHIMVSNPLTFLDYLKNVRVDNLTFHLEACSSKEEVFAVIDKIHQLGMKAGLSVKPGTPVQQLEPFLKDLDLVLIMSVEPGFGGQKFMEDMMSKGDWLDEQKVSHDYHYIIEIDGGINEKTAAIAKAHHFEALVAGSYCFRHPNGFAYAVDSLL